MAAINVYIEIANGFIVGIHNSAPNTNSLPLGTTIINATVEDPMGLLGLKSTDINLPVQDRPKPMIEEYKVLRAQLKSILLEIQLSTELGENTTALISEFNTKKTLYLNSLPQ